MKRSGEHRKIIIKKRRNCGNEAAGETTECRFKKPNVNSVTVTVEVKQNKGNRQAESRKNSKVLSESSVRIGTKVRDTK